MVFIVVSFLAFSPGVGRHPFSFGLGEVFVFTSLSLSDCIIANTVSNIEGYCVDVFVFVFVFIFCFLF